MSSSFDGCSPGESGLLQELKSVGQSEPSEVLLHVQGVSYVFGEPVVKQDLVLGLKYAIREAVGVSIEVFIRFRNEVIVEPLNSVGGQLHVGETGLQESVPVRNVDTLVPVVIVHAEHQGNRIGRELQFGQ